MSDTTTRVPKVGEVWRNAKGAVRRVESIGDDYDVDDEKWCPVMYSRPSPAPSEWQTTTLYFWRCWIEDTNAKLIRKAG